MTGEYGADVPLRRYSSDLDLLKEILLLLSYHVAGNVAGKRWNRAVLSIDYANGERIDWSIPVQSSGGAHTVFMKTAPMLYMIPRHPIRMIGLAVRESEERLFTQSTLGDPSDRRERSKGCDIADIAAKLDVDPDRMVETLSDITSVRDLAERLRRSSAKE